MDVKTINIEIKNSEDSMLTMVIGKREVGTRYDSNACRLVFNRPPEFANNDLNIIFSPGANSIDSPFDSISLGTGNEYLIPNALTQSTELNLQAFFRDGNGDTEYTDIKTLTLRESIRAGNDVPSTLPSVGNQLAKKLEASNLKAGANIALTIDSGNVTISSTGGGSGPVDAPILEPYITQALPGYLRETRQNINPETVVGLFLTDTHANTKNAYELQNMYLFAELIKELNPCFAAHLGNYLSDSSTGGKITNDKNGWLDTVNEFLKPVKNMKNQIFALRGNHDLNLHNINDSAQLILAREFYSTVINPLNNSGGISTSGGGLYCYKDFDNMKLRVICLDALDITLTENGGAIENPSTFGFKIPQLNWLANEALDLTDKDGYNIIVLCHIPPTEELMYFNPSSSVPIRNSELLVGILNAFKTGNTFSGDTTGDNPDGGAVSVTYSEPGNLIAYIHGHIHADNMRVPDGIDFQVVSLNSGWARQRTDTLPEGAVSPERVPDTLSGVCVTAMTYNASTRDVKFHRIGVEMEDTEFNDEYIEPVIPPTLTRVINFTGGKGVIPFGNTAYVSQLSNVTMELKFDNISGTQYILCADTPGEDRRFFVGAENGRIFYGFGDKGKTNGTRVFEAGKNYYVKLTVNSEASVLSVLIMETDVDADFVLDGELTSTRGNYFISNAGGFVLAQNANNPAEYFKGRFYSIEFANLAFYACNQTQGSVMVDESGYDYHIPLSGSYSWINRG